MGLINTGRTKELTGVSSLIFIIYRQNAMRTRSLWNENQLHDHSSKTPSVESDDIGTFRMFGTGDGLAYTIPSNHRNRRILTLHVCVQTNSDDCDFGRAPAPARVRVYLYRVSVHACVSAQYECAFTIVGVQLHRTLEKNILIFVVVNVEEDKKKKVNKYMFT